jgi:UDP-glucuronate 4-epimerase
VKLLLTGAAGFIGFHTAKLLLERGDEVVGVDNLNDYYDPELKLARLRELGRVAAGRPAVSRPAAGRPTNFRFVKADLGDRDVVEELFRTEKFERVVHLAAQAGVRYSIQNPHAYLQSNVTGFLHVLEGCRHGGIEHLVYASTSSVYGANSRLPFSEQQNVDHPLSLYAATKKANELMAHSYSSLYRLPTTGLRFFTVYGPWGRPDMALFLFTKNILAGKPIDLYNEGNHQRDFTYVDDIARGVAAALDHVAAPDPQWDAMTPAPGSSNAPYKVYNIGNQRPVSLLRYIDVLEQCLGRKAVRNLKPNQPGDILDTWADVEALARDVGYRPRTALEEGVKQFVEWYLAYYRP